MPSSLQAFIEQRLKLLAGLLMPLLGGLMTVSLLQPSMAMAQTLLDDCGSPVNISLQQ